MSFDRIFSVFRVAGTGLAAQRQLLDATASNIANVETTETATGRPYAPRRVQFSEDSASRGFAQEMRDALGSIGMLRSSDRHFRENGEGLSLPGSGDPSSRGVSATTVLEQDNPFKRVYEPENPAADVDGYVDKPNVNTIEEMAHMMTASRAYEANVTVLTAAKAMMKKALEI